MTLETPTCSPSGPRSVTALLEAAIADGVPHCVLRGRRSLDGEPAASPDDVVILTTKPGLGSLRARASRAGFVEQWAAPGDREQGGDRMVALRLTTAVEYGGAARWLRTDARPRPILRRAVDVSGLRHAGPADEIVDLVLHCVLDLRLFSPEHRRRTAELLQMLRYEPALGGLAAERVQQELAPALTWGGFVRAVVHEDWWELLSTGPSVRRHLVRRSPVASIGRLATAFARGAASPLYVAGVDSW